jgi:hypothetical protein
MKRSVALPLALVLMLALAAPALAVPPVVYTGTFDEDYMASYLQPCPGIEVWTHEVLTFRQTVYFDNEGNVESVKVHFIGTDTFHTPANPGVELTGKFSATAEVDLETGEYINARGLPVHINIPGYGGVLMWAGFWSRYPDSHDAGLDTLQNPEDREAFCSFLSGQ